MLYDRDCGFCVWSAGLIQSWDRNGRLRFVAIQSAAGGQLLDAVPEPRRLESWHLARSGDEVLSGGEAVAPLLRSLPHGAAIARLAETWPSATGRCYRFVAGRRTLFGRILRRLGRIPSD